MIIKQKKIEISCIFFITQQLFHLFQQSGDGLYV